MSQTLAFDEGHRGRIGCRRIRENRCIATIGTQLDIFETGVSQSSPLPEGKYRPRKQRHSNFHLVGIAIAIIWRVNVEKRARHFVPHNRHGGNSGAPFVGHGTLVRAMGLQPTTRHDGAIYLRLDAILVQHQSQRQVFRRYEIAWKYEEIAQYAIGKVFEHRTSPDGFLRRFIVRLNVHVERWVRRGRRVGMDVMRDARTMRRWTDEQHLYKVFKIITMFVLREDSKDEKRKKKKHKTRL